MTCRLHFKETEEQNKNYMEMEINTGQGAEGRRKEEERD
jgi:hypothetical protein